MFAIGTGKRGMWKGARLCRVQGIRLNGFMVANNLRGIVAGLDTAGRWGKDVKT